jgi:exodeoxyribonuclease V gamma subunit
VTGPDTATPDGGAGVPRGSARPPRTDGPGAVGLIVHRSSDLDVLADALVEGLLADAPVDPLAPIDVVVQTGGVARWLRERIAHASDARGRGIAANVRLPFLSGVVDGIVAATEGRAVVGRAFDATADALPHAPAEADPWMPERAVWSVLDIVEDGTAGTERLRETLGPRPDGVLGRRTFELARGVADVLDHYVVHAPGLLRDWTAGRDVAPDRTALEERDRWQPALWRALVERLGDPVARFDAAVERLASDGPVPGPLPARLDLFGFEVVQERHLRLFAALATRVPVHLHLVGPSPARWREIRPGQPVPPAAHPLLVASGRAADRTIALVRALSPAVREVVHEPRSEGLDGSAGAVTSLLATLRAGVRGDAAPPGPGEPPALTLAAEDDSVRLHVCHGLARQAEVLRDQLLTLFEAHPHLEPRDVLVVSPDVEAAAGVLAPAFAAPESGARLPLVVADRQAGELNEVGAALEALIGLVPARAAASEVLDLLGRPVVARRLGLDGADLARFATWVDELGIRWGVDERHRGAHGQPAERAHTWRAGLDRLLLGVAMADEDDRVVADVAPYDHTVGDEVERAGRFVHACEVVFRTLEALAVPRDGAAWAAALDDAIDALFEVGAGDDWLVRDVRSVVAAVLAPVERTVDVGVVAGLLRRRLGEVPPASGYATGAVTLCAPIPLRSVPARVVCLFGFDDGTFPRRTRAPGYDLVTARPGGHDPRDEDRLLLLDAVLAAREHLVVTTTGRDPRTNEVLPPAVPVSELTDVIERLVGEDARRALVEVHHPLQPWSPRAFEPEARPRSFDRANLAAARVLARGGPVEAVPPLLVGWDGEAAGGPATGPGALERVRTSELVSALRRPLREFLASRLGVRLEDAGAAISDEEPLALDGLDRYRLVEDLLRRGPDDREAWLAAAIARHDVPAGTPGRVALQGFIDDADRLRSAVAGWCRDRGIDDTAVLSGAELAVAGRWHVVGETEVHEREDGIVAVSILASRSGSDEHLLGPWIEHLLRTAVSEREVTSVVARFRDREVGLVVLDPIDADVPAARAAAREQLATLLAVRERARREPLPLFRHASFAQAGGATRGGVRDAFLGDERAPGDLEPEVELVTDATDLDEAVAVLGGWQAFEALAAEVWTPLVAAVGAPR